MVRPQGILSIALTSAALSLAGCGHTSPAPAPVAPARPAPAPTEAASNLPAMTYADGWDEINMVANWAKTTMDALGHFHTDRNVCGMDGYGSLDLEAYNPLSGAINDSLKAGMGTEDFCMPSPTDYREKYVDGSLEVKQSNGSKILLLEGRGNETCTKLKDHAVAQKLLAAANKLVQIADVTDASCGIVQPH